MLRLMGISAVQIFSDWVIPEGIIQRELGDFYKENPVMARVIVAPIALTSGVLKVALFPIITLVGILVMPIIAAVRACQGDKQACEWLKATGLCVLGFTGSILFIGMMCYYMPLIASTAFLVSFLSVSIICHVYKLSQEPAPLLPT